MKRIGYWKSRVVPTFKKLFDKIPKKAPVVDPEACKNFDDSKEAINKEIEEKKTELKPKVVEVYEATSAEVKALVREPKEDGLKEHSAEVQKFLEELVKIEFPGSKAACEISSAFGPVAFIFEKVCVFLPAEEKPREVEILEGVVKTEEPAKIEETKPDETTIVNKEIDIVDEKKEEVKPESVPVLVAAEETKPNVEEEKKPAVEEEKKSVVEETKPAVEEKKPAVEEEKPTVEEKKLVVEEEKPTVEEKKLVVEEEKKPSVEEKKPVEEAKTEVLTTAVPVAETPLTKAPETPAAEVPKA